jgi:hypothetical protein
VYYSGWLFCSPISFSALQRGNMEVASALVELGANKKKAFPFVTSLNLENQYRNTLPAYIGKMTFCGVCFVCLLCCIIRLFVCLFCFVVKEKQRYVFFKSFFYS